MNSRFALCSFALAIALRAAAAAPISTPIYIEDSHAGSFYWLAEHLDLNEPCTLLHFDAHSDASAVFDSDEIRTQLRRVTSTAQRGARLREWRKRGSVQCFNWIEPLMPSPIARVIWVPGERLGDASQQSFAREAQEQLDGQLEASPRADGNFAERARVLTLEQLTAEVMAGPVIATIDLDYFAQVEASEQRAAFERVWRFVSQLRNLRAITIAISRPYLRDDAQAAALLELALRSALSLPTARVHFEPFATVANDRSLRAREYRAQGREVPAFDVAQPPPPLKALLLAAADRITVRKDASRWQQLLQTWTREAPVYHLAIAHHQPSTDGMWRVRAGESSAIELKAEPWDAGADHVEWIAEVPLFWRCNLTAASADEIGFAQGAPPRPRWRDVPLLSSGRSLPVENIRHLFDRGTGCGAVRLFARVVHGAAVRQTPAIEIRASTGTGFRAGLMEQFGLPYLYGSGGLRDGDNTGPETGWGADCANFLVAALRREGVRIPWSNPRQLRRYLEPVADGVRLADAPPVSADDLARGLFLHFGRHVAVVMEDRPPVGRLSGSDVVAHQLEGRPELIALEELLHRRGEETFDLLRTPPPQSQVDLLIGGDVMLGRSVGDQINGGVDPFADLRDVLSRASARAVNLECVISEAGTAALRKRYALRAPPDAVMTLVRAGFGVIGMANNHALDFGGEALLDCIERLRGAGAAVIGVGSAAVDAYAPHVVTTATGRRIALLAFSDVEAGSDAQLQSAAVATATNRIAVARAIREARSRVDVIVAMVHWGDENTSVVTERQRELARWLVNEGVDVIAGSHPHCLQPLDFYRGRPIAYSLGNLVFDGAPTVRGWNEGQLLEISAARGRAGASVRSVTVRLDRGGIPREDRREPPSLGATSD